MSGTAGGPDIDRALAVLAAAGVVAAATDTVFGLLCDPRLAAAVERVYALKQRPAGLELTILAGAAGGLEDLVVWNPAARRLAAELWPGPLSIVLPVGATRLAVPRRGTTLSVRVPAHDGLRSLLDATGPLASTSANRHGEPPATTAAGVAAAFGDAAPVVLSNGHPAGMASTIIDCSVTPPRVLRDGPIDARTLRRLAQD